MTPPLRVLYLEGDRAAARYFRAALNTDEFRLVEPPMEQVPQTDFDVCILSDLPYTRLGAKNEEWLIDRLMQGRGMLLVGGWNSYGRGQYANAAIAEHFPVRIESSDDRVNLPSGAVVLPVASHQMIEGFSFQPPPVIAGFNRIRARRGGQTLLEARRIERHEQGILRLAAQGEPILVAGENTARIAAVATDLAPHWSAGWTDWGDEMVHFGDGTEMGNDYVQFIRRLVLWTGSRDQMLPALTLGELQQAQ